MAKKRTLPPGMYQRGDTYCARFRAGGRQIRKRLSTDFKAACMLLNELKTRADKADFGILDNALSWDELKKQYLTWKRQMHRTADECARILKGVESFCKVQTVAQINHEYIARYRDHRKAAGVCPRTINKEVGVVSAMLSKGVEWGLIGSNPIEGIDRLPHDVLRKQRRSLTAAEVQALLDASPAHLRPVWRTFVATGMRKEELAGLLFSDFDERNRTLTVRAENSKNRKPREIPLDDVTFELIRDLRDAAQDRQPKKGWTDKMTERVDARFSKSHIFVTNFGTPWDNNLLNRFYACCKRAGIEDGKRGGSIDLHSLRVTFATLAIENGASPKAVQDMLGHSTLDLTMAIYSKASDSAKRAAVAALPFSSKVSGPEHILSAAEHTASTAKKTALQIATA